jgi:hypothetical protein
VTAEETELDFERANLRKADRDIAAGEKRIARVHTLIGHLTGRGLETGEAERTLLLLETTLTGWIVHRELIRARIDYLEHKLGETKPGR